MSASKKSVSIQQLLLIVGAVVVAILLFQLPKMVVKNEKEEKEKMAQQSAAQRDKPAAQREDIHKVKLSDEDKTRLNSLRKQYNAISDKEKKRIFADSLVNTYLELQLYDSVAVFMDGVVKTDPTRENLLKAGEAWVQSVALAEETAEQDKRLIKGRGYYQQVLDKNPKDEEARIQLGLSYVGTNEPMTGILMLRAIVDENPKSEQGHFYLGLLGMQSKQFDKAAERFETVVKLNPKNINAWFQLGIAYKELGINDKARNAYKKARSLETDRETRAMIDEELDQLK